MGYPMGGLECKNPTHGAPLSGLPLRRKKIAQPVIDSIQESQEAERELEDDEGEEEGEDGVIRIVKKTAIPDDRIEKGVLGSSEFD
jgi:hypothetical protein